MGAGQSDLYKKTYGDTLENVARELREDVHSTNHVPTETEIRGKYIRELSKLSPKEIYDKLKDCDVLPLGKGDYKGVPFEEGGGFRVLLEKDGSFLFHPEGRHHNQGQPYYKLSTGYSGTVRFDVNGGVIDE